MHYMSNGIPSFLIKVGRFMNYLAFHFGDSYLKNSLLADEGRFWTTSLKQLIGMFGKSIRDIIDLVSKRA